MQTHDTRTLSHPKTARTNIFAVGRCGKVGIFCKCALTAPSSRLRVTQQLNKLTQISHTQISRTQINTYSHRRMGIQHSVALFRIDACSPGSSPDSVQHAHTHRAHSPDRSQCPTTLHRPAATTRCVRTPSDHRHRPCKRPCPPRPQHK